MSTFIDSGDSRETSQEIIEAILYTAGGNEKEAVRIWADPTEEELIAIWERVTVNGLTDSKDYFWGAASNDWARDILSSQTSGEDHE